MSTERNETHIVRRHARRLLLPLLVAFSIVAGCGDESNDSGRKSAQSASPATATNGRTSNRTPILKGQLPPQVLAGTSLTFVPEASDPDGDALTFSATGLPAWMSIDAKTGALISKPGAGDVGSSSNVVISVSDGRASASLPVQSISVVATASGKATLSWVPPTEHVDGSPITNLAGYRIRFGIAPDALTQSIDVTNAGLTSYVVENLIPATWYFSVTAYTAAGIESGLSNLAAKTITG